MCSTPSLPTTTYSVVNPLGLGSWVVHIIKNYATLNFKIPAPSFSVTVPNLLDFPGYMLSWLDYILCWLVTNVLGGVASIWLTAWEDFQNAILNPLGILTTDLFNYMQQFLQIGSGLASQAGPFAPIIMVVFAGIVGCALILMVFFLAYALVAGIGALVKLL